MSDELQPALFDIPEDDLAILLSKPQLEQRYTAGQVSKIERLREAVVLVLAAGWSVEAIARHMHLNVATVRSLAAQEGEKLASSQKEWISVLKQTAGRWLALAKTKEQEAPFKDLVLAFGILSDKAAELAMMGQVEAEKEIKEDVDHVQAAEALRRLMSAPIDSQSTEQPLSTNELASKPELGAGNGAGQDQAEPGLAAGGGGGSEPRSHPESPMGSASGGCLANGPPHDT